MSLKFMTNLFRRGLALIANITVLCILLGLLWWGRAYKWKVPSFAALTGAEVEEGAKVENAASGVGTVVSNLSPGNPALDGAEPALFQVTLSTPETVRKAGIESEPAKERSLAQYVTANGAIEFDQTQYAELSPLASGKVWAVLKKDGDRVQRGEVLGLIAAPDVASAKAGLLQGLLQVEVRSKLVKRLHSVEEGVVSVRDLREAEASLAEAQLKLFRSLQTLINLGLPVDLEKMRDLPEKEQAQRLRVLGVPESIVKETDPAVLPTNLLPLIAPFDGEVVKRDMVKGEVVTSSQVQMVVADPARMWIRLDVRQEDAPELKIDQEVRFDPDNAGLAKAVGRIIWIRRDTDQKTRTVHVRAEADNSKGLLRPNTFGTGYILIRSSDRVVTVPTKAIQREGTNYFVFVKIDDTVFEQRRITLGIRGSNFTEARSGIRPGETVVRAGSHILMSAIVHSQLLGEN